MIIAFDYLVFSCMPRCFSSMNHIQSKVNSKCQEKIEEAITNAFIASIVDKNRVIYSKT